jgi:hypothetical protein
VAATGGDDNMVNLWRMREKETKNIMVRRKSLPKVVVTWA